MKRLMLAAVCLWSLSCCAAWEDELLPFARAAPGVDETAAREAIGAKVTVAIAANDFVGLNAMGQAFLASRARLPGGGWKLAMFHSYLQYQLGEGLEAKLGCEYRKADFVQRWAKATPRSPLPFIVDAKLQYEQAWCLRGSGFADDVSPEAWPKFEAGIAAAAQILDRHSQAAIDPEFYATKVEILRSQGNDRNTLHALLDKATAREPSYYPLYANAVMSYMPQWGGSFDAVDRFARYAAQHSAATEQSGFYARVYTTLEECGCVHIEHHPDWPMMKQAMRDIYAHYPVPWNGNLSANFACRSGDTEEGKWYIRAMYPETTDDHAFVALFATCANEAAPSKNTTND